MNTPFRQACSLDLTRKSNSTQLGSCGRALEGRKHKFVKKRLTFKSGDPNFSRPRIVKLGGDRIMLLGFTNLAENNKRRALPKSLTTERGYSRKDIPTKSQAQAGCSKRTACQLSAVHAQATTDERTRVYAALACTASRNQVR